MFTLNKGKKYRPDYYSMFMMGIIWLPFGIIMSFVYGDSSMGYIFIALGIAYMAAGLIHKKDWKKNHKSWKQMTDKEKRIKMIILGTLSLLLLIGIIIFLLIA